MILRKPEYGCGIEWLVNTLINGCFELLGNLPVCVLQFRVHLCLASECVHLSRLNV